LNPPALPEGPKHEVLSPGRDVSHGTCAKCHGDRGVRDGNSAPGMKDDWGQPTWPSDLTWRPLKRGPGLEEVFLSIGTGLAGTPMLSYGDSLGSREIWALVYSLESLVSIEHRLSPLRHLGEEQAGWMVIRMHGIVALGIWVRAECA